MKVYHHTEPFTLECGAVLPTLDIAYHTYGILHGDGSNVVWICHALTAKVLRQRPAARDLRHRQRVYQLYTYQDEP